MLQLTKYDDKDIFRFGLLSEFTATRYLLTHTKGRLDGSERAQNHLEMSYMFVAFTELIPLEDAPHSFRQFDSVYRSPRSPNIDAEDSFFLSGSTLYQFVHDHTQLLTSRLDEVIGFPVDSDRPDYDELTPKFLREFYRLGMEAKLLWLLKDIDPKDITVIVSYDTSGFKGPRSKVSIYGNGSDSLFSKVFETKEDAMKQMKLFNWLLRGDEKPDLMHGN